MHVRFAPKATVADQNVFRRFVPGRDSCTAANSAVLARLDDIQTSAFGKS
jgi:hypothetical protein